MTMLISMGVYCQYSRYKSSGTISVCKLATQTIYSLWSVQRPFNSHLYCNRCCNVYIEKKQLSAKVVMAQYVDRYLLNDTFITTFSL